MWTMVACFSLAFGGGCYMPVEAKFQQRADCDKSVEQIMHRPNTVYAFCKQDIK